ncbi:MAG: hypothetical protein ACT4PL_02480 [Phycisphaerales bacterium]
MNIQTPTTASPDATTKDAAERTIQDLLSRSIQREQDKPKEIVASQGLVLQRIENLTVPGSATTAQRFYVSLPALGKSGDARTIYGYTIFKPSPTQYVAFELICADKEYESARRQYELSVATARFDDPETLATAKRDAVRTGVALLNQLTAADFDAAVAQPTTWFRFFKPAPSGLAQEAEERGYRTQRFMRGTRAQLDPRITDDSPAAAASPTNPAGILAELTARQLIPLPGGRGVQFVDVHGRYFITENRDQEAWSIRMSITERRDEAPKTFTETATRGGRSLTVVSDLPGQPNRTTMPVVPPEGYISQVEKLLLPRLMTRAGLEGEVAFYLYQTTTQSVSLRRDALLRGAGETWVISTREKEGVEPERYTYRATGELVRAELRDGVAMEPTTGDALMKLWQSKGLPVK